MNFCIDIRLCELSSRDNAFAVGKKLIPTPLTVDVQPGRFP
jgi:hypothetical protein